MMINNNECTKIFSRLSNDEKYFTLSGHVPGKIVDIVYLIIRHQHLIQTKNKNMKGLSCNGLSKSFQSLNSSLEDYEM